MTDRFLTIAAACTVFLLLLGVQSNSSLSAAGQNPTLGRPSLLTPANRAIVKGTNFTQSWSGVEGAHRYEYQSYNDAKKTKLRAQQKVSGTTTKTIALVPSGTFWWQVRAIDAQGRPGSWSTLRQVTTDNEAPTIRPLATIGDKPVKGMVRFVFESADKHLYRITSGVFSEVPADGLPIGGPEESGNIDEVVGLNVTSKVTLNINTLSLPNGRQTIIVNAGDRAGNVREERFYFTVANPVPSPETPSGEPPIQSDVVPKAPSPTARARATISSASVEPTSVETSVYGGAALDVPGRVLAMEAQRGAAAPAATADTTKRNQPAAPSSTNGVQYLTAGLAIVVLVALLGVVRFVGRA